MSIAKINMQKLTDSIIVAVLKRQHKDTYEDILKSCGDSLAFIPDDIAKVWDMCKPDEDRTRLVIAASLVLFSRPTIVAGVKVKKGLATAIAECKGVKQEAISNMISTSVYWYEIYPLFRNKVDRIVERFKNEK